MNTTIQHAPQRLLAVAGDWQPFADRLAGALAMLGADQTSACAVLGGGEKILNACG